MGKEQTTWTGLNNDLFLDLAIDSVQEDIIEYVDWYSENGLFLPDEFSTDPGAWTQILRDIQQDLIHLRNGDNDKITDGIDKCKRHLLHLFK